MLSFLSQGSRRHAPRRRLEPISHAGHSQLPESPGGDGRRHAYLKGRHFVAMVLVAVAFHGIVIYGLGLLPKEEVKQVPVRSMSLKLGNEEAAGADGGGQGNGEPAGGAPQATAAAGHTATAEGLPESLPHVNPDLAPEVPSHRAPKEPAMNMASLPAPSLPMQMHNVPSESAEPNTAPDLEAVEVADTPVAAVANKPVMPKVSASTTQNLADLPLTDKNFPRGKSPQDLKKMNQVERKRYEEQQKQERLRLEQLKKDQAKAEKQKQEQLRKLSGKKDPKAEAKAAKEKEEQAKAEAAAAAAAATAAAGKRYVINDKAPVVQNPIPANVGVKPIRLPVPAPGAQEPQVLGALPPAPAIAPQPTQYVRANDASPQMPQQAAPEAPLPNSAAAVAAGIAAPNAAPQMVAVPGGQIVGASANQAAAQPQRQLSAAQLQAQLAAAGAGQGTGQGQGAGQGTGQGTGQGAGQGTGQGSAKTAAAPTAGEKAQNEARKRYELTISQWIAKHKVYPAGALLLGQHGKVVIRLRIDRAGNVKYSAIEQSSGFKLIDRAALDMVARANPVPAVPSDYPPGNLLEFLVPASFDLQ